MVLPIVDPGLRDLVEQAGDDGYRIYVERLRWPAGPECPRCESSRLNWLDTRTKYHCLDCRYQFRVTAGTIFHGSHVPLRLWLDSVALILSSETGYPATELQRALGGSYKTAWFVEHRIRAALGTVAAPSPSAPVGFADPETHPMPVATPAVGSAAPPSIEAFTRLVAGAYRKASLKYLSAYWNEARWRADQRGNDNAFRDTIVALLQHPPLPYRRLLSTPAATLPSSAGPAPTHPLR